MGIDVISQFDTLKVKADMNVSDIKALNVSRFLHFKSGAVTSRVPARIVNISQDKSVNEGDDVNLFCLAVGRPEPTVNWKDFKYGLMREGEFLEITEIKRHQAEEFECITNNGVAPPDTRRVKVTVN
ncbi:hypothetical protein cypCar_00027187, partial [Cyprinus carpio]